MNNKTALVTGGAGFIGSHVVDTLLQKNYKIICIDNFDDFYSSDLKERNVQHHFQHDKYNLLNRDIRNYKHLETIEENIDLIIHIAAKAGVRPSINNPLAFEETNVKGTNNLLEFAKNRDIKKFIFASSSSVYGINNNIPWKEEDNVLKPISPYASTKVSAELMGHVYSHLYNIQFLALRFFTVYGPRQRPDLAINKFVTLLNNDEEIPVYGDGSTQRDYTFIDDVIQGILGAINYDGTLYEIINIGNNKTISLLELIKTIERTFNKKAHLTFHPEQPGDVPMTYADITKAKKLLGYQPSTSIEEGIQKFKNWFQEYA